MTSNLRYCVCRAPRSKLGWIDATTRRRGERREFTARSWIGCACIRSGGCVRNKVRFAAIRAVGSDDGNVRAKGRAKRRDLYRRRGNMAAALEADPRLKDLYNDAEREAAGAVFVHRGQAAGPPKKQQHPKVIAVPSQPVTTQSVVKF